MSRPRRAVLLFGLCLVVLFGAMAWLSSALLDLERAERQAREDAAMEEAVRLALWRMDSAVAPLLAELNSHPLYAYETFYPAELNRAQATTNTDGWLVPSPLLTGSGEFVKLHFRIDADGELRSPQVPGGPDLDQALDYVTEDQVQAWAGQLDTLRGWLQPDQLLAAADAPTVVPPTPFRDPAPERLAMLTTAPANKIRKPVQPEAQQAQQQMMNTQEFNVRTIATNELAMVQQKAVNYYNPPALQVSGMARPLWMDSELVLARRLSGIECEQLQGAWLDWPSLSAWLVGLVPDLLPGATLEPLPVNTIDPGGRTLAALPARLVPGALAVPPDDPASPVRLTLVVAWTGVVLAALAVAALLWGTVSLSERRAAFVSAVTHEMRTPLTTFRMYSEMLAGGMVTGEKRARYLQTLQREADRLGHLVENVLAYARLERGRATTSVDELAVGDLLDRALPRLADRAVQADMEVVLETHGAVRDLRVRADTARVEQILLNLVDNACKYAADADDRTIHLDARVQGNKVVVCVRDHGPGIARSERRRLFQPFTKSAEEAAQSAPGVGLGLAISRSLARDMGGDLAWVDADGEGAALDLALRRA